MTREDIIRAARRAGAVFPGDGSYHTFERIEDLEHFAFLVAAAERENFCATLRQMHDAYSLASDPSPLKTRSQS